MPIVSRFYGIVVRMYHNDHNPPHFHAKYGDDEALIVIDDRSVYAGHLPSRAAALVDAWAADHKGELATNWDRMRAGEPPLPIDPLD